MKYILFATATLYVLSQIAFAQKRNEHSSRQQVTFKVKNAGIEVTGTIDIVDLQITFNERELSQSSVFVTADPNKINTGIRIRDNHLRRSDYFDVDRYPAIKLQSKGFKKTGKSFEGNFDLTIRNVTKSVVATFTRRKKGNTILFAGSFTINRKDFKLGEDSSILDNVVTVYFNVAQQ